MDDEKNVFDIIQLDNKVSSYDYLVIKNDDEKLIGAMTSLTGYSIEKIMNKSSPDIVFDLFSSGAEQMGIVRQKMYVSPEEENMITDPKAFVRRFSLVVRLLLMIFPFTNFNMNEQPQHRPGARLPPGYLRNHKEARTDPAGRAVDIHAPSQREPQERGYQPCLTHEAPAGDPL